MDTPVGATLVTGAASGIGRATAAYLATRGHRVVLTDLPSPALDEAATACGGVAIAADVTSQTQVARLFDEATARGGPVTGLAHCAGVEERPVDAREMSLDAFHRTMDVNVTGSFLVCREMARRVPDGTAASIVLIGSILSAVAYGGNAAYTASKGAVLQLGRALAIDLAPARIRVNVIGPGVVATPMSADTLAKPESQSWIKTKIPLGRPAEPVEIAAMIATLLEPQSSYVTGAFIPVDGGWLAL